MKYIDEFRNKDLVLKTAEKIKEISKRPLAFMEVCGGHTMSIQKFGIPSLLPANVKLLSGPGCPVCVSDRRFIDKAIEYSRQEDVIITTYGDLLRVPGSHSSLENEKAEGHDIRMVYSTLEAIAIAEKNPGKRVIFLGIGFETTTPASAAGIVEAEKKKLDNFLVFSSHKVMPPAMAALINEGVKLDGYICPGHVSTVTGTGIYMEIPEKYGLGCVISGFEPLDLLQTIYMLVKQLEEGKPSVEIQYKRVVKPEGNLKARSMMEKVFEPRDDWWRGLGVLPNSGLGIKKEYRQFDAEARFPVEVPEPEEPKGCVCGEVLKGITSPGECKLFGKACTPRNPVGACMVSSEGACAAYYKYNSNQ